MVKAFTRSGGVNRGRMPDGSANPIDKHIGAQIRRRRLLLNISQEKLGALLGLTFQQIQKYEQGMNRVSGSRIWDLCQVLGVDPNYFFMEMDSKTANESPRMLRYDGCGVLPEISHVEDDPLLRVETLELITAYYRLKPRLRELFAETIKQAVRTV